MLFSIVVPVYNVESYLKECLDSILEQEIKDYEVILVDDGSTDSSGIICDLYVKKDDRFKVIHKKNEGLLMARRTGMKQCIGDYIMHCDSDDYLDSTILKVLKDGIDRTNADMILYGYDIVDDSHKIIEKHYDTFDDNEVFNESNKERLISKITSTTWLNNMWSKVTKRSCVDIDSDYSKYKNIKMGEDLFQVVPLVEKCKSFLYIAKPLYHYRKNATGMSKNITPQYIENHIAVGERTERFLKNENISNSICRDFYNRYTRDLQKYLLRFLMNRVSKREYENLHQIATRNLTYLNAMENKKDLWSSTKILALYLNPKIYCFTCIISKYLFKNIE